jgi:hypothetical protein
VLRGMRAKVRMNPGRPLVDVLKSLIERTYDIPPLIEDLAPFIVGDEGYRRFYARPGLGSPETGARILVRATDGALRAAFYCPDSLVRHLEMFNPLKGLGDVNIEAFAVLVEEVDHLVTLASRASEGRPVTLLELEHHANITKYLAVVHFLGKQTGSRRVAEPLRQWARFHLFERYGRAHGAEGARYHEAARLAWRYLRILESLTPVERVAEIRTFHRRTLSEILHLVGKN